jgi:hypothetical protein
VTDPAGEQLVALARVHAALEEAGLEYWLFGGWAVDFHVGAVTRAHDDVDIAVWQGDVARIAGLLEADGWRHVPSDDDNGGTGFERGPVRLELTFLVREADGAVVIPLRDVRASWPSDATGFDALELMGAHARVLPLASLEKTKSPPREDPDDAPKDRADYEALRRMTERD